MNQGSYGWSGAAPASSGRILQEVTTRGAAPNVDFADVPPGRGLTLWWHARGDSAATQVELRLQFNGDTGNNYDHQYVIGYATNAQAAEGITVGYWRCGYISAATAPAGAAGSGHLWVPDHANDVWRKQGTSQLAWKTADSTNGMVALMTAAEWRSTRPIVSIHLGLSAGNFAAGSRFTLCGL